jgi:SAM-dependent methyltransferase
VGTAQVQGRLWGSRAEDWSEANEPAWDPVFEFVLGQAGVMSGTRLLDVGCGAGRALSIAHRRGAEISGLDASEGLAAVARRKLPAARIEVGEMEELPFEDAAFDVVTGINAFQFAADLVRALSEARRVCRTGGTVMMLVWGRREDCELMTVTMPALFALLPPAPPTDKPAPVLSEPGVIEELVDRAGLTPTGSGEFSAPLAFPDAEMAVRAILSAGPSARAIDLVGEEAVASAVVGTLRPVTRPGGSIVWNNRFRWVTATPR